MTSLNDQLILPVNGTNGSRNLLYYSDINEFDIERLKEIDPKCKKIKKILLLNTGGTIVKSKVNGIEELESNFLIKIIHKSNNFNDKTIRRKMTFSSKIFVMPMLHDEIRIVFNILEYNPLLDSTDITTNDYIKIAKDIFLEYEKYDAFIITHGTDTMSYTGSALSFMLENLSKPIILTGSQIPISEIRSDGINNLLNSFIILATYTFPEVCIFFNDKLLRANRTSKISTFNLDGFDSPNFPHLAIVGLQVQINSVVHSQEYSNQGNFTVHLKFCPNVVIIRLFPTITSEFLRSILTPEIKGVLLLTYGTGNIPQSRPDILDLLKNAFQNQCIILNITQCWKGGIHNNGEIEKYRANYGIYPGYDMTVEAAWSKLSYVLSKDDWTFEDKLRRISENLRGEMNNLN